MTNLELLNALACSRYKTCYFSDNVEETSGLKIFIKITDHFTRTSANLINCITCPYCNKFYISETERRLGDRFWEHCDVERNVKAASNQSLDTLIFLIILNSIWKFVVAIDIKPFPEEKKSHKRRQKSINFVFNKKSLNERDINICIGDSVFSWKFLFWKLPSFSLVIVINSVIGGFGWVDLVWLAASKDQVQMSDYSQLLDYTVQFELSRMISKKLSC